MNNTPIRKDYLAFGKPNFSDEEIAAVTRTLRSGWVGMGPEVAAFEQELAPAVGVPHVVTVNSCTSALFLSLLALGVKPGDEVLCPSLTWCATANAALCLGAIPIFCDIDPETLNVTPETLSARVTDRTRAALVVHFGGLAADVAAIRAALPERVAIVEDAAHALGGRYQDGSLVGSSGNLVCFSFYANKNLATGEGGAIALSDGALADRLRSLRQNAMPIDAWKRFSHARSLLYSQLTELGYKMNYTDLQACIGRVQLRRQPEFQVRRLAIARRYCEQLRDLPLVFQKEVTAPRHTRHLFVIRLTRPQPERNALLMALRDRNVGATVHYAPLHQMPLYANCRPISLPHTESVIERIMTLPIGAAMSEADAEYVSDQLADLMEKSS